MGVVTARLDTFAVRFHFFSPYLFFQPTASLFFLYPHVYLNVSRVLFGLGTNKKLERCIKDTRGIKKRIAERRIK